MTVIMEDQWQQANGWLNHLGEAIIDYTPKVLLAIVLLLVGLRVVGRVAKLSVRALEKAGLSATLLPFMRSLVSILLKVLLLVMVAGIVGVDTASLVAVLAAASFAVGLALQGSLSNFAAGIIILLFRPYQIDDWIEVEDKFGRVQEIQIFSTLIVTPGQKVLVIPNGKVIDNIITNHSIKGYVRLELSVFMAYEENFPRVQKIIQQAIQESEWVLHDPAPQIGIESYESHYIVLAVRPFVQPDDFWAATFDVHARIKRAFSEHHIKMAYSEGIEMGAIGA